jgi:NADH:ubiquinone oxidoreductase subunit E
LSAINSDISDILNTYPASQENLIPLLHEVQRRLGFLPLEAIQQVAAHLHLSKSAVYGVATFYAGFKFQPSGRHSLRVCRGTACHVRGSDRVLGEAEKQLGIKPGETTADGSYTLETEACFGSCALAPVVVKDGKVYGRQTPANVARLLGERS